MTSPDDDDNPPMTAHLMAMMTWNHAHKFVIGIAHQVPRHRPHHPPPNAIRHRPAPDPRPGSASAIAGTPTCSPEPEIETLVGTCAEVAAEASTSLGDTVPITVQREQRSVLLDRGPFGICVRHHLELFRHDDPYARVVVSRRRSWRQKDVEVIATPTIPLVAVGDGLAWNLEGRPSSARRVAEWAIEYLLRLGR